MILYNVTVKIDKQLEKDCRLKRQSKSIRANPASADIESRLATGPFLQLSYLPESTRQIN